MLAWVENMKKDWQKSALIVANVYATSCGNTMMQVELSYRIEALNWVTAKFNGVSLRLIFLLDAYRLCWSW